MYASQPFKYVLYDIDNNGVREFIIGNYYNCIVDVFTLKDGQLIRLTSQNQPEDLSKIGKRETIVFTTKGQINYSGSGGAQYHVYSFLEINQSGDKLSLLGRYQQFPEDIPNYKNVETNALISKDEFAQVFDSENVIDNEAFPWIELTSSTKIEGETGAKTTSSTASRQDNASITKNVVWNGDKQAELAQMMVKFGQMMNQEGYKASWPTNFSLYTRYPKDSQRLNFQFSDGSDLSAEYNILAYYFNSQGMTFYHYFFCVKNDGTAVVLYSPTTNGWDIYSWPTENDYLPGAWAKIIGLPESNDKW
jgi:hypothetical protein